MYQAFIQSIQCIKSIIRLWYILQSANTTIKMLKNSPWGSIAGSSLRSVKLVSIPYCKGVHSKRKEFTPSSKVDLFTERTSVQESKKWNNKVDFLPKWSQSYHQNKKWGTITKTCLYNFDPHKPYFYIVKLGLTGVYIIFLISAEKHRSYSLEPPRRGVSNEYQQSMFMSRNMKNIRIFIWKFSFFGGKIFSTFE